MLKLHRRSEQPLTHQHLLELLYCLIGNTDAIDLTDLISYMQSSWCQQIMI